MLTEIFLENFKIFTKVRVKPKKITVFTGQNGSGKSTILQGIMLLQQSDDNQLRLSGPYVNFDTMSDIQHTEDQAVSIGFSGEERVSLRKPRNKRKSEILKFSITAKYSHQQLVEIIGDTRVGDVCVKVDLRGNRPFKTQRMLNWGWDANLSLIYAITLHTHTQINAAIHNPLLVTLPIDWTAVFNKLTSTANELVNYFEKAGDNEGLCNILASFTEIAYAVSGNGSYLHEKGVFKL